MAQIRVIKKRMQAVATITRITKTMQMIATAKFTAAAQRAKATKPYTEKVRKLVAEVAAASDEIESPLISGPSEPARRELLLVISSDRGLCGAFNATVIPSRSLFHSIIVADGRVHCSHDQPDAILEGGREGPH